jgi:hypothetical protein
MSRQVPSKGNATIDTEIWFSGSDRQRRIEQVKDASGTVVSTSMLHEMSPLAKSTPAGAVRTTQRRAITGRMFTIVLAELSIVAEGGATELGRHASAKGEPFFAYARLRGRSKKPGQGFSKAL